MNSVLKYAKERLKLQATRTAQNKPKVESSIDANGVDLAVLTNGGITKYKKWDIYVHTSDLSRILPKGKWHFMDALGNRIFIKTLKREIAQEFVNQYYGRGMYVVSASCTD